MVRPLANYDESRFWKRLVGLGTDPRFHGDRTALETLRGNVRQVADHSGYILRQIVRFLPQYTLHDEDHILNVLGLMDALTPDEVMGRLTPLECACASWRRTPTTSAWRCGRSEEITDPGARPRVGSDSSDSATATARRSGRSAVEEGTSRRPGAGRAHRGAHPRRVHPCDPHRGTPPPHQRLAGGHEGPGSREQPEPLHLRGNDNSATAGADRRQPRQRRRLARENLKPPEGRTAFSTTSGASGSTWRSPGCCSGWPTSWTSTPPARRASYSSTSALTTRSASRSGTSTSRSPAETWKPALSTCKNG